MPQEQKTYRIRTEVGNTAPLKIDVNLNQTFDTLEILSLKLTQENAYNLYNSSYGVIVGRVLANGGFGIPNAKLSIFIDVDEDETNINKVLYPYTSVTSADNNGVRYNLLPDEQTSECHQNVGTFPNKRLLLDNKNEIEIFDKYWKYTTVTNEAGDYMFFGIPKGNQKLHVDIDLSDIGVLSQRPRDMIYKGYDINLFESPNKFKQSTNLNSLSQIVSQDRGIYVYSFWGDTSDSDDIVAITRCDIEIEYKFEPTCVFMGSIITDTGSNAIAKNCSGTKKVGRMEDLVAGEGSIEMIRKTLDGKVEECQIKGNRVIDGNGVWCYQIPMNLDYVRTDEYGNIVPTDDPDKGIPTRTRVRFRISLDENPNDAAARKRCRYLVPNNPRINEIDYPLYTSTKEVDYEFGTATRDESYVDLLWNKVYTVKNYIPRLQKTTKSSKKNHTGIKAVNVYGDNNPFPYNGLTIKLSFTYRLICIFIKVIIMIVTAINAVLSLMGSIFGTVKSMLKFLKVIPFVGSFIYKSFASFFNSLIPSCITFSEDFCDDGINNYTYAPGCWGSSKSKTEDSQEEDSLEEYLQTGEYKQFTTSTSLLYTCIENSLMQEQDGSNFNFSNDWINGCLYAPLWFRKKTPKKSFLFGLFRKKAKDQWCSSERSISVKVYNPCALNRTVNADAYASFDSTEKKIVPLYVGTEDDSGCSDECYNQYASVTLSNGVIVPKTTLTDATVYYYKPLEYDNEISDVVLLFATDIVLLGSLNECDLNGLPQFFKNLDISTYQLPDDILLTDYTYTPEYEDDGETIKDMDIDSMTEMSGCDWGNTGNDQCGEPDGGLFYGVGCSKIDMFPKSCINLTRICEYGVSLDDTKFIHTTGADPESEDDTEGSESILIPDGFISYDELYALDERSMFATLNGNKLRTKLNSNGMYEYDLRYLYPENFDGSLREIMSEQQSSCSKTAKYNYKLEAFSEDYYRFRMGDSPLFYDSDNRFPRYENSFYFYFGLKAGETAIEQFNSQFFASCTNDTEATTPVTYTVQSNDWCSNDCDTWDGYITLNLTNIATPYSVTISSLNGNTIGYSSSDSSSYLTSITYEDIEEEMIYFSRETNDDVDSEYTLINDNDKDEAVLCLLNDTYVITIVDSSNNETSIEVNMANKYLSFTLESDDFTVDENTLLSSYGSYCKIAQDTPVLSEGLTRDIGGVLRVKNLYYLNKNILSSDDDNDYLIVIQDSKNSDGFYVKMTLCTSGSSKSLTVLNVVVNGSSCSYSTGSGIYFDKDGMIISFGLPYYDTTYSATITQLCSCDADDTTGNKYTLKAEVSGPTSVRLEINDIDYDLISGFTAGATCSSSGNVSVSGSISGWTSLSNYTDSGPYNWDNWLKSEYCYSDYYEETYQDDGYESAEAAALAYRKSVIKEVKEAFWMNCNGQNLLLYMTTDYSPVTYSIIYKEEETSDSEDLDYQNVLSECSNGSQTYDGNYIQQIEIPTLSYEGSEYYDSSIVSNNLASYFCVDYIDGSDNNSRYWKHPYFVKAIDANGSTIPYDGSYFGVHIIDKELKICDLIALAYINGIPYYYPSNSSLYGEILAQQGFLSAIICNGIADFTDVTPQSTSTFYTTFEEQTLGGEEIDILTVTQRSSYEYSGQYIPDEDALPTKRLIVGDNSSLYSYYDYLSNNSDSSINITVISSANTYTPLDYEEIDLVINDGTCEIEEPIYGSMSIEIDVDNSYNSYIATDVDVTTVIDQTIYETTDEDGETNTYTEEESTSTSATTVAASRLLTISVKNGEEVDSIGSDLSFTSGTTIYLIEYNNNIFIVNKIADGITSYSVYKNCYVALGEEIDENDGYILTTSNLAKPSFYGNNDTTASGTTSESGILEEGGKYFILAVTSNGCRTVSPVYDFTLPVIETIKVYDNSDGCQVGVIFSENYYLKYYALYEYSLSITVTIEDDDSDEIKDVKNVLNTIFSINPTSYEKDSSSIVTNCYSISSDVHGYLYEAYNGSTASFSSIENMYVEVIDYTGLTHKCTLNDVSYSVESCGDYVPQTSLYAYLKMSGYQYSEYRVAFSSGDTVTITFTLKDGYEAEGTTYSVCVDSYDGAEFSDGSVYFDESSTTLTVTNATSDLYITISAVLPEEEVTFYASTSYIYVGPVSGSKTITVTSGDYSYYVDGDYEGLSFNIDGENLTITYDENEGDRRVYSITLIQETTGATITVYFTQYSLSDYSFAFYDRETSEYDLTECEVHTCSAMAVKYNLTIGQYRSSITDGTLYSSGGLYYVTFIESYSNIDNNQSIEQFSVSVKSGFSDFTIEENQIIDSVYGFNLVDFGSTPSNDSYTVLELVQTNSGKTLTLTIYWRENTVYCNGSSSKYSLDIDGTEQTVDLSANVQMVTNDGYIPYCYYVQANTNIGKLSNVETNSANNWKLTFDIQENTSGYEREYRFYIYSRSDLKYQTASNQYDDANSIYITQANNGDYIFYIDDDGDQYSLKSVYVKENGNTTLTIVSTDLEGNYVDYDIEISSASDIIVTAEKDSSNNLYVTYDMSNVTSTYELTSIRLTQQGSDNTLVVYVWYIKNYVFSMTYSSYTINGNSGTYTINNVIRSYMTYSGFTEYNTLSFEVVSGDIDIITDAIWTTTSTDKYSYTGTLTLIATENTTSSIRSCNIVFTQEESGKTINLAIYQAPSGYSFSIGGSVTETTIDFTNDTTRKAQLDITSVNGDGDIIGFTNSSESNTTVNVSIDSSYTSVTISADAETELDTETPVILVQNTSGLEIIIYIS